jgi:hypothetical protein
MTPRIAAQRKFPFLHPIRIPLVQVDLGLVLPPQGKTFPAAEDVRVGVLDTVSTMTRLPCRPPPSDLCAASQFVGEVGPVDPATRSFTVYVSGELRPLGWNTPPIERQFSLEERWYLPPPDTDAGAVVGLIEQWAVIDPEAPARRKAYRGMADGLFASVRIGPAR